MRSITRDKLAKLCGNDQEVIRYFEQLAEQSAGFADGNYGDISIVGGQFELNPGVVGLTEVDADVLDRANQTGTQAIATIAGLQAILTALQAEIDLAQPALGIVAVPLAFGATFTDKAQTVVVGQPWVGVNSKISATVPTPSGIDPDEMYLLNFTPVISDLIVGVGFTVTLYSEPEARGTYTVNCIGA